MNTFQPDIPTDFKSRIKKFIKKIIQPVYMPAKDKGKRKYYHYLTLPINDKCIFYEAFAGLGILDNPRAIFKALLSDSDFQDFTHIWAVDNITLTEDNLREFSLKSNVKIIKKDSADYYKYLATSKYLISNSTFGYFFEKRPEQVYINTWHGVPTKYMGYEHTIERVENSRGPARNYLMADYLISANRFMTDVMYRRAYKADGLFEGKILETGYPRSDSIIHADTEYVSQKLNDIGIKTDKKIILYAPTWKGNLYNQLDYDVAEFKSTVRKLSESINGENYRIYLRVHYFLYKILAKDAELEPLLIPFTIDTNELLSVVDVLISDYSSIFFDFITTNKPIVFYMPDLEQYSSGRGLYVPISKLPGFVSSDLSAVADVLGDICADETSYTAKYAPLLYEMKEWCSYNDDGDSCKRLIDIIFHNKNIVPVTDKITDFSEITHENLTAFAKPANSFCIIDGLKTTRKKLLICVNTRYGNSAFFEELKTKLSDIDYKKTDVTLLVTSAKKDALKSYYNTLPSQVRILVWYALPFVTPDTPEFYQREIRRTLGNTHFDEVQVFGRISDYWSAFANNINTDK
jgi:CDP-glycerol glycerophosphotransferase (TagB/SpsB family)